MSTTVTKLILMWTLNEHCHWKRLRHSFLNLCEHAHWKPNNLFKMISQYIWPPKWILSYIENNVTNYLCQSLSQSLSHRINGPLWMLKRRDTPWFNIECWRNVSITFLTLQTWIFTISHIIVYKCFTRPGQHRPISRCPNRCVLERQLKKFSEAIVDKKLVHKHNDDYPRPWELRNSLIH